MERRHECVVKCDRCELEVVMDAHDCIESLKEEVLRLKHGDGLISKLIDKLPEDLRAKVREARAMIVGKFDSQIMMPTDISTFDIHKLETPEFTYVG